MQDTGGDFMNTIKHPINTLKAFIHGKRYDFRPQDRQLLQQIGNKKIDRMTVYRKPLNSAINSMLNALSLGNWNEEKKKYGYDNFFHLYLKVDLENGHSVKVEKNEVITITPTFTQDDLVDAEYFPLRNIYQLNLTLDTLLNNTRMMMGDALFFSYNPFTNNCQNFLLNILRANRILQINPDAQQFIYQDKISEIIKNINPLTQKVAETVTDTAHRFNILTEGAGLRKLDVARKIARKKGIKGQIDISERKNKRFKIKRPDGQIIHFGVWPFKGHGTYIDHNDDKIRKAWQARHSKIMKDGSPAYLNPNSPDFYSFRILW